jgi:hypothetical protein
MWTRSVPPLQNRSHGGLPMTTAADTLARIDACHDDHPDEAATLLRTLDIAALPAERHASLAYLFNHVLGEKLARWSDAHERQEALLAVTGDAPAPLRQAAVAARLAGQAARAASLSDALARAAQVDARQATQLVELSAVMFSAPSLDARRAGELALQALRSLDDWCEASALDAAAAAACNNLASGFIERPPSDLAQASLRAALAHAAECSQRLWQRGGTWVNRERACYLRAMASHALGEPHRALAHAREGLALLDAHDAQHEEDVDRGFLELELAHACRRLGLASEADAADQRAQALADAFNDEALTQWFASRRAKLATMLRG